jgi:hypothetical protein
VPMGLEPAVIGEITLIGFDDLHHKGLARLSTSA